MSEGEGRRRCAVLGLPIAHSLSPALHSAAYRHLGLDWEYGRYEVDEAGLPGFLDGLDDTWRGLSLTMPLKFVALDCVDEVSDLVRQTSAINTILFDPSGRRTGDNTDIVGMTEALREKGAERSAAASILGGGATARSALVALRDLAEAVTVYIRTPARAPALEATAGTLGLPITIASWDDRRAALDAPLIISTTPAGATDDLGMQVPERPGILLDVVYAPWPTALAQAWSDAGGPVAGGRDMLVHQAVRQVELMTGRTVPAQLLRDAGEAEMARRQRQAT